MTHPPPRTQVVGTDYQDIKRRLAVVEQLLAAGAGAYGALPCLSTGHPVNPKQGAQILETDTGLSAYYNGTAWVYPPQLITSVVLGASATSVVLPPSGSIPQVFKNLRLIISAKSSGSTSTSLDPATLQFNATTSGYNWNSIQATQLATAVAVTNAASQSASQCMQVWNDFHPTAGRGIAVIEIPNYSDTACFKSFTSRSEVSDGGTAGGMQVYSGALNTVTAAITSLTVAMTVGQFKADSSFYLYGE